MSGLATSKSLKPVLNVTKTFIMIVASNTTKIPSNACLKTPFFLAHSSIAKIEDCWDYECPSKSSEYLNDGPPITIVT